MSAQEPAEIIPEKRPRTRRSHHKVRSGCSTCKIRRKKCDETKPSCLRCTSTGRKCDGYAPAVASSTPGWHIHTDKSDTSSTESKLTKATLVKAKTSLLHGPMHGLTRTIARAPPNYTLATDLELSCFDYFKQITGPQLGAYHDSSLWRDFVIRAALLHPVVMKAAAAVGAAHRRCELGISREAFEYCAVSDRLFSEAKRSLRSFKEDARLHQSAAEINAGVEFLYGVYQLFQDNHSDAAYHMTEALCSLLNEPFNVLYSDSRYQHIHAQPDLFRRHFTSLEAYATQVMSRGPKILTDFKKQPLSPVPNVFISLEEGLDFLFTQLHHILNTPVLIWCDRDLKKALQAEHVHSLFAWSSAFAETIRMLGKRTRLQARACLYLRRMRNMTYLLLYLIFCAREDQSRQRMQEPSWTTLLLGEADQRQEFDSDQPSSSATGRNCSRLDVSDIDFSKDLVIDQDSLWRLINNNSDIMTNISRTQLAIDELLNPASKFEHHPYTMSINMDTGIGPPRLSRPGPGASAKTRHLVRSLLDPTTRETLYHRTYGATSLGGDATIPTSECLASEVSDMAKAFSKPQSKVYGIGEQLCSIEEHAIYAAVQKSLVISRDLNPRWVDISCYLEDRKVLLRYCSQDNDRVAGAGRGMIWTQEWLSF